MYKKSPGYLFNVYLDRQWEYISTFRHFICDLIYGITNDYEKSKSLETGLSELIDNALKYSINESDIHITAKKDNDKLIFDISNYPKEDYEGEVYNKLKETLNKIQSMNPVDAYVYSLQHEDKNHKLCLGFAKIRYESDLNLSVFTNDNNMLTIEAIYNL